jgi:hypothetical protein
MNEEDVIRLIQKFDSEIKEFRLQVNLHRTKMLEAETELIGAKIHKSRLEEELRIIRSKKISTTIDETELEVQEFQKKYPELVEWANNGRNGEPPKSI